MVSLSNFRVWGFPDSPEQIPLDLPRLGLYTGLFLGYVSQCGGDLREGAESKGSHSGSERHFVPWCPVSGETARPALFLGSVLLELGSPVFSTGVGRKDSHSYGFVICSCGWLKVFGGQDVGLSFWGSEEVVYDTPGLLRLLSFPGHSCRAEVDK